MSGKAKCVRCLKPLFVSMATMEFCKTVKIFLGHSNLQFLSCLGQIFHSAQCHSVDSTSITFRAERGKKNSQYQPLSLPVILCLTFGQ